jgi:hypothetical protein
VFPGLQPTPDELPAVIVALAEGEFELPVPAPTERPVQPAEVEGSAGLPGDVPPSVEWAAEFT